MDPFSMVVWIVLITAIASVAKAAAGKGHVRRRDRATSTGTTNSQPQTDKQTKKEIELFKLRRAERDEARKTYERIVMEKLDVMKTAISMGMDKDDLKALDSRLEKLIGQDRLGQLLEEQVDVPEVSAELMDADLLGEIERLQRSRQAD